jgi:dihydroorotate dehydrogenase electron transfer subunit
MLNELKLDALYLYTEDGSVGKKGNVTTDINDIIKKNHINMTFSCGPDEMFREIYQVVHDMETSDYASLEALMGCGFGICGSCVIPTRKNEYKKVCMDGPIFNMEEIAW